MNFEEMKDWCNDAQRSLGRELDRLQEQQRTMDNHLQVLKAADELLSEIVRQKDELVQKQSEIDNMTEQLEQKDQEIMELRQQLLEAKNRQLESERQHLETEVRAKPMVNAIRCSGECRWQKHGHWRWQSVGVGCGLLQTPMRCGA